VHCIFRFARILDCEYWTVQDNHSMNGTFINGTKIAKRRLRANDEIVFGGGPHFHYFDHLESTLNAYCRYRFFIPDPIVKFTPAVDPNASLPAVNTRDPCPICYDPMIEPEELRCGHSFCLLCLHEWALAKIQLHQRPVCPICRASFRPGELRPREAVLENGEMKVWTVEPLLRGLGILSCRTIKGASIFKFWSEKHRKWFWKALDRTSGNLCHRRLFLSLVGATVGRIVAAAESELIQALQNFEIAEVNDNRGENIRKLLLFLFERKVIPDPPRASWLTVE
jgi:hypothetical protein